ERKKSPTAESPSIIADLEKEKERVEKVSIELYTKQISQQKELTVAIEKCEALIQKVAHKHGLTNFTYDQQKLKKLTSVAAVVQFAQQQMQAIKVAENQKLAQSKTEQSASPKPKQELTTTQKALIGGGVVG